MISKRQRYAPGIYLYTRHWKYGRNMTMVDLVWQNAKTIAWNGLLSIHDFETLAPDRRYLVLQYSVAIIAHSQQVLSMKDLSGT